MAGRLSVGIETNCTAPIELLRLWSLVRKLMKLGVGHASVVPGQPQ